MATGCRHGEEGEGIRLANAEGREGGKDDVAIELERGVREPEGCGTLGHSGKDNVAAAPERGFGEAEGVPVARDGDDDEIRVPA